eukprot:CAMPEP_0118683960 /NCGR_PEP_ID=MMETSP0800-20121206/6354_1 /TAXON_ID=210618 ORGANISM="Striatella unipunctata, Strain CCMP2910" /NCGR_SAMPLE_ID=MMETSP0800 /ASSEMBLY_ACC=CAM_ASM_000638 /LENGTH=651 /DNA_ID=CAMNT_0006580565 /DNA_START=15 /DNA_END=1971 /DNA_ORIENTATION=-
MMDYSLGEPGSSEPTAPPSDASWPDSSGNENGAGSIYSSEHDQLPSVEEVRMNVMSTGKGNDSGGRCRLIVFITLVVLAVIFIIVTIALLATGKGTGGSSSLATGGAESIRLGLIRNFLNSYVQDGDVLTDTSSPQYRAMKFLADNDAWKLPVPAEDSTSSTKFLQRFALSTFYYSTLGETWKDDMNFLTDNDECAWFKIFVDPSTRVAYKIGTSCTEDTAIVNGILLPNNALNGTLPRELELLSNIEFISMEYNGMSGPVPPMFGMKELSFVALDHNDFTGTLGSYVGSWPKLTTLALSNNRMTGTLPEQLSTLPLEALALDDNGFRGSISAVAGIKTMRNLYLEDNSFLGTLVESYFGNMTNLRFLDLSRNNFVGTFPSQLMKLNELVVLDLHGNKLTGGLGLMGTELSARATNSKLSFLALHNNEFSSNIPASISLLKNLRHLDVSGNKFQGILPSSIGSLTGLTYLFAGQNSFDSGPIPSFIGQLTRLEELSLKRTFRTNKIPDFVGNNLTELLLLDLDDNQLTGEIPINLGGLSKLYFLLLNRNRLTGSIPVALNGLENIQMLLLDNNTLMGSLDFMCGSTSLDIMYADCGGSSKEVNCSCCQECCVDSTVCYDNDFAANQDPIWENGYIRTAFIFDNAFGWTYGT